MFSDPLSRDDWRGERHRSLTAELLGAWAVAAMVLVGFVTLPIA